MSMTGLHHPSNMLRNSPFLKKNGDDAPEVARHILFKELESYEDIPQLKTAKNPLCALSRCNRLLTMTSPGLLCTKCRILQSSVYPIHTSVVRAVGEDSRIKRGLSRDGLRYGPLVDLPDYSYVDGRPVPMSPAQKRRREDRKQLAARVMQLINEVDFAVTNNEHKTLETQNEERDLLRRKLTPKVSD